MSTRVAAACTVLAGAVACGGGAGDAGDDGAAAAVRRDYLAYWDAFVAASAAADPDLPELHRYAGGTQLATLRQNLTSGRDAHRVTRGEVRHDVRSVDVDGDRARLVDCVDLDGWLYHDARTGAPVKGQLVDKPDRLVAFVLARTEGRWVVTGNEDVGPC